MKNLFQLLNVSIAAFRGVATGSREEARTISHDPHFIETFHRINQAKGFDAGSVRARYANLHLQSRLELRK